MRKKVLSLTLVAAMMAGCLAGCGNADSKDEGTTAAAGDSTTQAAASDDAIQNLIDATTGTVDLSVWASEEDQDLTTQVIEEFKKKYSDVDFNITLGAESESKTWYLLPDPGASRFCRRRKIFQERKRSHSGL